MRNIHLHILKILINLKVLFFLLYIILNRCLRSFFLFDVNFWNFKLLFKYVIHYSKHYKYHLLICFKSFSIHNLNQNIVKKSVYDY